MSKLQFLQLSIFKLYIFLIKTVLIFILKNEGTKNYMYTYKTVVWKTLFNNII